MVSFRYQNAGRPASRRETSGVTMTDVRHFTILCSPSFCRLSNNITLRSHPDGQYKMFIPNRKEESQLCHIRFLVALLHRNDKMIVNLYFETASGGGSSAEGLGVGLRGGIRESPLPKKLPKWELIPTFLRNFAPEIKCEH